MSTDFPHTANCPTCGGLTLCLSCNAERVLEADAIVRELTRYRGLDNDGYCLFCAARTDHPHLESCIVRRAVEYVKGGGR